MAVEVVELHPLSEEDEEVANQGHLEDGDLVGTRRCPSGFRKFFVIMT